MSFVEVEAVSRHFDQGSPWVRRLLPNRARRGLTAVEGVSFAIERGTTFAMVGESGSGKSTLAKMIVGLLPPSAGQIRLDGLDLSDPQVSQQQKRALRRRIQMVFQSPYASLNPRWRVGAILAEPLHAFALHPGKQARADRVVQLLEQVGLAAGDARKFPHEFSGGQRQRISIARALASEPEMIVCDEPTSALDVSVQAQVLNLLKRLQRDQGLTYLFISHDLAVVSCLAHRVGVLKDGRLVEEQGARDLFERPQTAYTHMLLDAAPKVAFSASKP